MPARRAASGADAGSRAGNPGAARSHGAARAITVSSSSER